MQIELYLQLLTCNDLYMHRPLYIEHAHTVRMSEKVSIGFP